MLAPRGALSRVAVSCARALSASNAQMQQPYETSSSAYSGYAGQFNYMEWEGPGENMLFVPGPVNIPQRVQRAMNRPSENHRDPHFFPVTRKLLSELKYLFKTEQGRPFVFPSSGTGAWEAALTNTLSPGDKVVAFRYGQFSHLWVDMAQRLGLDVEVLNERWGRAADEERLKKVLQDDTQGKVKAVLVVHNETATGVTADIKKCREAMDEAKSNALLMVDGVSSIGACEFKMDDWNVDLAITGSQKALSLPTGLGIVCASPKALEWRKSAKLPRCYFSFDDMMTMNDKGNWPYTPSIPLVYGLLESLQMLKEEGLDNAIARHARLAEGARRCVKGWGLDLLCEEERWNSNSLTVVKTPEHVDSTHLVRTAFAKYNLTIGLGLSEVAGKVFRIGHLGSMNETMLLSALSGTEMALLDCGVKIEPGRGVGEAVKYFQQTSSVIPTREMEGVA